MLGFSFAKIVLEVSVSLNFSDIGKVVRGFSLNKNICNNFCTSQFFSMFSSFSKFVSNFLRSKVKPFLSCKTLVGFSVEYHILCTRKFFSLQNFLSHPEYFSSKLNRFVNLILCQIDYGLAARKNKANLLLAKGLLMN